MFLGHTEVASLLIKNGAELNLPDKNLQGALHLACFYGKEEVTSLLLQSGCDPDLQDSQGQRPIDVAMEMGNTEIAEILRKHHKVPEIRHSDVKITINEEKPVKPQAQGQSSANISETTTDGSSGRGPSQKSKSSISSPSSGGASATAAVDQTNGRDTSRTSSPGGKKKKGRDRHSIDGKVIRSTHKKKKAKSDRKRESLDIDETSRKRCLCCVIS